MPPFFLVVLFCWLFLHGHLLVRVWQATGAGRRARWLTFLAAVVGAMLYPAGRAALRSWDGDLAWALHFTGACWIGLAILAYTLLLLAEGADLCWRLASRLRGGSGGLWSWLGKGAPGRGRKAAALLTGVALALAAASVWEANCGPRVVTVTVTVPPPFPAERSLRLVQFSDSHLGVLTIESAWERTVGAIADQAPDAVLMAGDVVEEQDEGLSLLARLRNRLPELPFYLSLGNHERHRGEPELVVEGARELGIRTLRQEGLELAPGLWLAAIDDDRITPMEEALARLLPTIPPGVPLLLMSHRPSAAHLVADRSSTLMLSGHTHGGQLPPAQILVPWLNGGFLAGLYPVGDAFVHISRGAGSWGPPMRLLAPADIVVLKLVSGANFEVREDKEGWL